MSGAAQILAGTPVWLCDPDGPLLDGERAATDIIGDTFGSGVELVVIPVQRLDPGFLTLSTRLAGEVIQKFVNYRLRLAIVGDITTAVTASDALRDFVRESNCGRHVWFVADMAELEAKLTAQA